MSAPSPSVPDLDSARMVVGEVDGMRAPAQGLLEDFAGVHERGIRRAARNEDWLANRPSVGIQREDEGIFLFVIHGEA